MSRFTFFALFILAQLSTQVAVAQRGFQLFSWSTFKALGSDGTGQQGLKFASMPTDVTFDTFGDVVNVQKPCDTNWKAVCLLPGVSPELVQDSGGQSSFRQREKVMLTPDILAKVQMPDGNLKFSVTFYPASGQSIQSVAMTIDVIITITNPPVVTSPNGPRIATVTNMAGTGLISSNTTLKITGSNLGPAQAQNAAAAPDNAQFTFCGIPALVTFNSGPPTGNVVNQQIVNLVVPQLLPDTPSCPVLATTGTASSKSVSAPFIVNTVNDGLTFWTWLVMGTTIPIALDQSGHFIVPVTAPGFAQAFPEQVISVYGTGCPTAGDLDSIVITIAGVKAAVSYSGLYNGIIPSPPAPGICLTNVTVPKGTPAGNQILTLEVPGLPIQSYVLAVSAYPSPDEFQANGIGFPAY